MTGLQELHDDILGLEAALAGKHMELALAQGDKIGGRIFMNRMNELTRERRSFRINISDSRGECYFDAAGQADRMAAGGGKK
ncbi:MAG: hypothetical protein KBG00_10675 [Rhodoferax sp.]|jgi:hypothetical protein|uniref:hypothetical protein n=1 Tax=Rhodoferax sp. TaxID=50421 RepID=UPI001B497BAE|nr:hypothetical protein [Rhodoferax sp.]MBP9149233.1 hypothetical protein [Rhodoferax sp.]MBP9736184.1 hypothetical protein [Rhodoferax sp.]